MADRLRVLHVRRAPNAVFPKAVLLVPSGRGCWRVDMITFPIATEFHNLKDADYLTTGDLCRLLGCTLRTIYRRMNDPQQPLKATRRAGRGEMLFQVSKFKRWLKKTGRLELMEAWSRKIGRRRRNMVRQRALHGQVRAEVRKGGERIVATRTK